MNDKLLILPDDRLHLSETTIKSLTAPPPFLSAGINLTKNCLELKGFASGVVLQPHLTNDGA